MNNKTPSVMQRMIEQLQHIENFAHANKSVNTEFYSMAISHAIQIANNLLTEERIQRMSDYTEGHEDCEKKIFNLEKFRTNGK